MGEAVSSGWCLSGYHHTCPRPLCTCECHKKKKKKEASDAEAN